MSFMKEKESALYSHYIIDGVICEATPAELLDECMEFPELDTNEYSSFDDIVDESTEPPLGVITYDYDKLLEYIKATVEATHSERPFSLLYPEHFTSLQIAKALLDRLWSEGHFRLCNLRLWAQWDWNTRPIGNLASFYRSCQTANEYIFGLGVRMTDYIFIEGDEGCSARFYAWLPEDDLDDSHIEDDIKAPYESRHPWIEDERCCKSTICNEPDSHIIYIPFDTAAFKLGGSLLDEISGRAGGAAPNIKDPDYFIDCYEVIRELVEDGIVMSGVTVADGGLMTAANRMRGKHGIDLDIKGLMSSYQEDSRARVLFGEIPGVLIQVSDENYDYVDSQFLLQDVAYYPLGHPSDKEGLSVTESGKNGEGNILASLFSVASEGED